MRDETKLFVYGFLLVLVVIFAAWFYSADASGIGQVGSKWVESSTTCTEKGGCTTSHTYYVQFTDGRVFNVFWGNIHWDNMLPNQWAQFNARGRHLNFWGWRVATPSIFSWEPTAAPAR